VALLLRRHGIERVRPLAGGFGAWRDLGYPLSSLERVARGAGLG
jgi:3-mercaptopyruvate sulfurtransferase SseA